MAVKSSAIKLVSSVIGKHDINRLINELSGIDDFLHQASIREPGTPLKLPKTGRMLDDLAQTNHLNLLQITDRQQLYDYLESLLKTAPLLHMSFTLDPSPLFMQKLIIWVRNNIHPHALLQIGLNPTIGAGCILRTPNKFFDLSLRQRFADNKQLLGEQLKLKSLEKETTAAEGGQS